MADANTRAFREVLDEYMNDIVDGIFEKSQKRLVEPHDKRFKSGRTKNIITTDTGTLLKTANVNREFLAKKIVYPAPYATDVEYGNAGIDPDFNQLKKWVKRKVFAGEQKTDGQIVMATRNIANSLKKRGQSPDPFLGPAILEQIDELERL